MTKTSEMYTLKLIWISVILNTDNYTQKCFGNKDVKWSVEAVCPVTISKNYNPTWFNFPPWMSGRASGSLSPLPLPALTSVLMDITFPFLHLCTQSVLARGKVSHQYTPQLHPSQPQIGEIIDTTAPWSPLCRNQFDHVAMTGNCSLRCIIGCLQVCLFLNFHSCKASIELKIQCLWPGEVGEQPYISKEGLR